MLNAGTLLADAQGAPRVCMDGNFAFLDAREDCAYLGSPIGSAAHCDRVVAGRVGRVQLEPPSYCPRSATQW